MRLPAMAASLSTFATSALEYLTGDGEYADYALFRVTGKRCFKVEIDELSRQDAALIILWGAASGPRMVRAHSDVLEVAVAEAIPIIFEDEGALAAALAEALASLSARPAPAASLPPLVAGVIAADDARDLRWYEFLEEALWALLPAQFCPRFSFEESSNWVCRTCQYEHCLCWPATN